MIERLESDLDFDSVALEIETIRTALTVLVTTATGSLKTPIHKTTDPHMSAKTDAARNLQSHSSTNIFDLWAGISEEELAKSDFRGFEAAVRTDLCGFLSKIVVRCSKAPREFQLDEQFVSCEASSIPLR